MEASFLLLLSKQNTIAALEPPTSLTEIDEQQQVFEGISEEMEQSKEKRDELISHGNELIQEQEEAVASAVKEKLDNLENGWAELEILCKHHIGSLKHQRNIQVSLPFTFVETLNYTIARATAH